MKELLIQIAIGTIILALIMMAFEHVSTRLAKRVGERVIRSLENLGFAMFILAIILLVLAALL